MSTSPADPSASPRGLPLDPRQRRVLGVLIEKAKTTPAAYPMSVNAIVTGCNQKSNRDPLTEYDDFDVEKTLDELRTLKLVTEIDWLGRVSKWKHLAYEWFGVDKAQLAVLAELLLRGDQSLGDLRARAARMEPIADLEALRPIVATLVERELMIELTPAGRGQIVSHNFYSAGELAELKARHGARGGRGAETTAPVREHAVAPVAATRGEPAPPVHADARDPGREIDELRRELAELRERVRALEER